MRVNSALLYAYVTHAEKESGEKIKGVILPSTSTAFLKDAESFANDKRWVSQLKRKLEILTEGNTFNLENLLKCDPFII